MSVLLNEHSIQETRILRKSFTGDGVNAKTSQVGSTGELWLIRKITFQNLDDTATPQAFVFSKDDGNAYEILSYAELALNTTGTSTRTQQRLSGVDNYQIVGNGTILWITVGVTGATIIDNGKIRYCFIEYEVIRQVPK